MYLKKFEKLVTLAKKLDTDLIAGAEHDVLFLDFPREEELDPEDLTVLNKVAFWDDSYDCWVLSV